jgi:hypothetical protein
MIGNSTFKAQTAEPAIGEIEMHLLAQTPFGAHAEQITNEKHPEHQFRINRGASSRGIIGFEDFLVPVKSKTASIPRSK